MAGQAAVPIVLAEVSLLAALTVGALGVAQAAEAAVPVPRLHQQVPVKDALPGHPIAVAGWAEEKRRLEGRALTAKPARDLRNKSRPHKSPKMGSTMLSVPSQRVTSHGHGRPCSTVESCATSTRHALLPVISRAHMGGEERHKAMFYACLTAERLSVHHIQGSERGRQVG